MSTHPREQSGPPFNRVIIKSVDPPVIVAIDLAALYGRAAHWRRPNILSLPDLHRTAVGFLDAWVLTETGWFGACRYKVKLEHTYHVDQSHLIPARVLRRATNRDIDGARMRGEYQ